MATRTERAVQRPPRTNAATRTPIAITTPTNHARDARSDSWVSTSAESTSLQISLPRGCRAEQDQRGRTRRNRNIDTVQACVVIAGSRDGWSSRLGSIGFESPFAHDSTTGNSGCFIFGSHAERRELLRGNSVSEKVPTRNSRRTALEHGQRTPLLAGLLRTLCEVVPPGDRRSRLAERFCDVLDRHRAGRDRRLRRRVRTRAERSRSVSPERSRRVRAARVRSLSPVHSPAPPAMCARARRARAPANRQRVAMESTTTRIPAPTIRSIPAARARSTTTRPIR